jgi:hypothetical protein
MFELMRLKKWYDDLTPYEQRDFINAIIKISGLVIVILILTALFG